MDTFKHAVVQINFAMQSQENPYELCSWFKEYYFVQVALAKPSRKLLEGWTVLWCLSSLSSSWKHCCAQIEKDLWDIPRMEFHKRKHWKKKKPYNHFDNSVIFPVFVLSPFCQDKSSYIRKPLYPAFQNLLSSQRLTYSHGLNMFLIHLNCLPIILHIGFLKFLIISLG